MTLGYNGKLYILAFDHRGSFQKKMFGIEGDPSPEETEQIADAKHLIFEGLLKATEVLVRYNPDGDQGMNERQTERLKRLADWLHEHDRKFLFELLVPAEDAQLEQVGGDSDRYDAELRPELMRRAIVELQDNGVEADIWKIEGIDTQEDCERISETCRRDGRDGVICVVLGRGANDDKVAHWLRQGAPVEGYAGFAIGRTIWWDALKGFLDGSIEREDAAGQIAEKYLHFVQVYREAAREHAAA